MNTKEYQEKAISLRHNPMVEAWIEEYQKDKWNKHKDCHRCGYPHSEHLLCMGAPFGSVRFGGHFYSIDLSNVLFMVRFIESHVPEGAFHWKDGHYFRRTDCGVEITFFSPYNNTPQTHVWKIPAAEWESIVDSVRPAVATQGTKP